MYSILKRDKNSSSRNTTHSRFEIDAIDMFYNYCLRSTTQRTFPALYDAINPNYTVEILDTIARRFCHEIYTKIKVIVPMRMGPRRFLSRTCTSEGCLKPFHDKKPLYLIPRGLANAAAITTVIG